MSDQIGFIKQILTSAKYRDQAKTQRDCLEVLNHYRGLKAINDSFVFNNGSSKNLLALSGTVPVSYKGATYNIPIIIWLLDTYPLNAPMVFVRPTVNMRIKVSRHIDYNGKVYLPYLHDWKHADSELMTLIQVLIMTFQEQPPVYSVPAGTPPQQQLPPQSVIPPYPVQNQQTNYPPYPSITAMPMPGVGTSTNSDFSLRPSLLSAAEEKLQRRMEDIFISTEILKKTGDQLKEGSDKLISLMDRMEGERMELEQNITSCETEGALLEEQIKNSKRDDEAPDIDDAIIAPTPLYKQLVRAFAEEAALEDSIYYVGEALRREKVDLESFLKQVRSLARRQFTLRATMQKCREKAMIAA